jgi:hypothetical protein
MRLGIDFSQYVPVDLQVGLTDTSDHLDGIATTVAASVTRFVT